MVAAPDKTWMKRSPPMTPGEREACNRRGKILDEAKVKHWKRLEKIRKAAEQASIDITRKFGNAEVEEDRRYEGEIDSLLKDFYSKCPVKRKR